MRLFLIPVVSLVLILQVLRTRALTADDLYTYGRGLDTQLPPDDESSSPEISLKVPIVLYGSVYESIFVNTNGFLSFLTDVPNFLNIEFPLDYPSIAPFYTNVDTTNSGVIYYRETQDAYMLAKATEDIHNAFPEHVDFLPSSVFIATWSNVGYHSKGADKVNTYQAVIISNGTESFVAFLYPEDGIQWIQGTTQVAGLPDARAQAGFVGEDGRYFVLKGSGTDRIQWIVSKSNVGIPGKYVFRVGTINENRNIEAAGENESSHDIKAFPQSCSTGGSQTCHVKATCVDNEIGFCCVCISGYYGNGKSCLKNDVPLRVNGKISGEINGQILQGVDLQAYVVMSDGRSYTALSHIPDKIGNNLQVLNILGSVIGWLFAKPVEDAKNGYQITGGNLNHTAQINYRGTQVTIRQHYKGLDVFDQLKMDAEIKGTIEDLPQEIKFEISDFEEQYSSSQPGLILSESQRNFKNRIHNSDYPFTIKQSITYEVCPYSPSRDLNIGPYTFKAGKNFIGYEKRERIIRFGMSSKITPLGLEDPCIRGRETCGELSSCVVEGDSYKCVCNPGYHYIYPQDSDPVCIDINECSSGTHNCDVHAQCFNQEGSFNCRCNDGYEGNGITCNKIMACAKHKCHADAQCYESYGKPICQCNEGFTGDGEYCWNLRGAGCEILQNCAPSASCDEIEHSGIFRCNCRPGYYGDGYSCIPEDNRYTTSPPYTYTTQESDILDAKCVLGMCWCPSGYKRDGEDKCYKTNEENDYTTSQPENREITRIEQTPIPFCEDGVCGCPYTFSYDADLQKCVADTKFPHDTKGPSGEEFSCNVVNRCHPYAQCVFVHETGEYQCQCTAGYEGNGIECIQTEISCAEVDICDVHATCKYDPGISKNICVCNHGYMGDGNVCQSVEDCRSSEECEENAECVFSNESQIPKRECVCLTGYSKDYNDACVPDGGNCNGAKCAEHATCQWDSDYQTHYCQCDSGYQGNGISECLPVSKGCNVVNDCGLNANCAQDTETGQFECLCNPGFFGDGYICSSDMTCQYNRYLCSPQATCVQRNHNYVCECNQGYVGSGQTCKKASKHEGNFLLLNQGMATLRVPFEPTSKNPGRPIHISYYQMAIGLDIDCQDGRVYWSDITGKTIKSSNYDGSMIENYLTQEIISPEGISVDWVSRNIFWTDSRKDTIEVANLHTKVRKVLFNTGLLDPRGIAVHPQKGKIFWSDWNRENPKIEWSNTDGTERMIYLSGDSVYLPNSLAIDFSTDELCYADAGTKSIECVQIDSKEKRTIATNCSYPFGLAITDTHYYWTDWTSQKIESLDRRTMERQKPMDVPLGSTGNKLYGMSAVPEQCKQLTNACEYENGLCPNDHLCLLDGRGNKKCICGKVASGPQTCNEY